MGFTWRKEGKTTPKAQMKIGGLVKKAKVETYNGCRLTASEISERMGIPESTVRSLLKNATSVTLF